MLNFPSPPWVINFRRSVPPSEMFRSLFSDPLKSSPAERQTKVATLRPAKHLCSVRILTSFTPKQQRVLRFVEHQSEVRSRCFRYSAELMSNLFTILESLNNRLPFRPFSFRSWEMSQLSREAHSTEGYRRTSQGRYVNVVMTANQPFSAWATAQPREHLLSKFC
ncbi:MAG: hypothetical protein ACTS46_00620 [Candidatus Hodgkinia cicadicola]